MTIRASHSEHSWSVDIKKNDFHPIQPLHPRIPENVLGTPPSLHQRQKASPGSLIFKTEMHPLVAELESHHLELGAHPRKGRDGN
jgi:hypothetical protein